MWWAEEGVEAGEKNRVRSVLGSRGCWVQEKVLRQEKSMCIGQSWVWGAGEDAETEECVFRKECGGQKWVWGAVEGVVGRSECERQEREFGI